jgi:hypothetical protein
MPRHQAKGGPGRVRRQSPPSLRISSCNLSRVPQGAPHCRQPNHPRDEVARLQRAFDPVGRPRRQRTGDRRGRPATPVVRSPTGPHATRTPSRRGYCAQLTSSTLPTWTEFSVGTGEESGNRPSWKLRQNVTSTYFVEIYRAECDASATSSLVHAAAAESPSRVAVPTCPVSHRLAKEVPMNRCAHVCVLVGVPRPRDRARLRRIRGGRSGTQHGRARGGSHLPRRRCHDAEAAPSSARPASLPGGAANANGHALDPLCRPLAARLRITCGIVLGLG